MKVLVTGSAGFIGGAICIALCQRGDEVLGIDNLSDYYDVALKEARLARLSHSRSFTFEKADMSDYERMRLVFSRFKPDRVVNMAAQAGVRYSLTHPHAYIDSNIRGFLNLLECCRHLGTKHLVFASSSSVYGANQKLPFSTSDNTDHPISLYAATKRSNELMAHSYSHLFGVSITGLRFFTVYGPWGRPDMAFFTFSKQILEGKPVELFHEGHHRRDFTYIDDIVEGVLHVLDKTPESVAHSDTRHTTQLNPDAPQASPSSCSSVSPYRLYNIGNHHPVPVTEMLDILEKAWGKKALRKFLPIQAGDVVDTYADIDTLREDFDFEPHTTLEDGARKFVEWYRAYYRVGT